MNVPFGMEVRYKSGECPVYNKLAMKEYHADTTTPWVSTKEISHEYIPNYNSKLHAVSSLVDGKWPYDNISLKKNPQLIHDRYVTSNNQFHGSKFYNEKRDYQPKHPLAPASSRISYIRPDWHRYIENGWRNGEPFTHGIVKAYNKYPDRVSEMKSKYTGVQRNFDGQRGLFRTPLRHLPMRENFSREIKLFHPTYSDDDYHHPLFKANPYLSSYRLHHRDFEKDLLKWKYLPGSDKCSEKRDPELSIKYRVRPMQDILEQDVYFSRNVIPPMNKETAGMMGKYVDPKVFFRTKLYSGCPPRAFQPPNFLCNETTYKGSYGKPNHCLNALNQSKFFQVDYVQTKMAAPDVMKTPGMYVSENKIYGSGDTVFKIQGNYSQKPRGKIYY